MKTILCVDDDPGMLELLRLMLRPYPVVCASNGREALPAAARVRPALIVMDLKMPEMDGVTALGHLKAREPTKDIPVIVLSGSRDDQIRRAMAAGAVMCLKKPVDIAALRKAVQGILETKPVVVG